MDKPFQLYELCNEYTSIIPNLTEDSSRQAEILQHGWSVAAHYSKADYGEKKMRDCDWIPPEGYTFTRFIDNGVNLEVLQPTNQETENVVLMVHGGSFIFRMAEGFGALLPKYAKVAKSTVVNVDYRCALNSTYQDMIDDVVGAYEWILNQGYDPANIIIAGDSSGGGTVLASMLYMRDHGYDLPAGIITLCACTNAACNTDSWVYNQDNDVCFGNDDFVTNNIKYLIADNDPTNPYISPYYGDFHDFPPMLMQVGSAEILFDDNRHIANKAHEQGVDVTFEIYENMFHDFECMYGTLIEADIAWQSIQKFTDKIFENKAVRKDTENLPVAL